MIQILKIAKSQLLVKNFIKYQSLAYSIFKTHIPVYPFSFLCLIKHERLILHIAFKSIKIVKFQVCRH